MIFGAGAAATADGVAGPISKRLREPAEPSTFRSRSKRSRRRVGSMSPRCASTVTARIRIVFRSFERWFGFRRGTFTRGVTAGDAVLAWLVSPDGTPEDEGPELKL